MSTSKFFSTFLLLLVIVILSACSSTPSHLIIKPYIQSTPSAQYHNKTAQLEVTDMRTARHIVQILQEGKAATLLSAEKRIEDTIERTLINQWQKQGLEIKNAGTNNINVIIEKAIISVRQDTINYQLQTEIIVSVRINNGVKTQLSTFKNKGDSKGPLHVDITVLESNFNQRLTNLLTKILANQTIQSFLK